MNYGTGDHFLHDLSRALRTFPMIALLGLEDEPIRPTAVDDLMRVFRSALLEDRLDGQTVAVVGPEELPLREAIERVAAAIDKRPRFWRMPVFVHRLLAETTLTLRECDNVIQLANTAVNHAGLRGCGCEIWMTKCHSTLRCSWFHCESWPGTQSLLVGATNKNWQPLPEVLGQHQELAEW